jgi:NADH-quinone oxidoreductase subunit A
MAHGLTPRTAFRGRSLYWTSSERNARRGLYGRGSAGQVVERGYELGTFGPIALFLVVAVVFPVVPLILSRFLAPNKPNPVKLEPYESGMETIGPTHVQFPIRYYLYALIFVIFDVEVIYLFPWALVYDKLPVIAAAEMAVFIVLLLVGLAYAWRKRAFEWQ